MRLCQCLCPAAHPQAPGVCEAAGARLFRLIPSRAFGLVAVPLCEPCAQACAASDGGRARFSRR